MNFTEPPTPVSTESTEAPKAIDRDEIVRHWIRRLADYYLSTPRLLGANRCRRRVRRQSDDQAAEILTEISDITGLAIPTDMPPAVAEKTMRQKLKTVIRRGERRFGKNAWREALYPDLKQSIGALGELLGLGDAEQKCLAFIVLLDCHPHVEVAAMALGCSIDRQTTIEAVAAVAGISLPEAREIFSANSRLMTCELFRIVRSDESLDNKFQWCASGFTQAMLEPGFDPLKSLRSRIVRSPRPVLGREAFAHVGELRNVTVAYLREALRTRRKGVNVLLHGDPGVGKSEFAKVLAAELQCDLFEVSTEDEQGDPIDPMGRFQALRVLHGFCAGQRCLLVFDEAEDVFPRPHPFFGTTSRLHRPKGWVNRMLENNAAATLWITNSVEGIDPAFVRRFDLVLQIKNPPTATKEARLRNLPITLPETLVARVAACEHLTPAVVDRAAGVLGSIQAELPNATSPLMIEQLINQTLLAQGHPPLPAPSPSSGVYETSYINSDLDLNRLLAGVRNNPCARICIYGPPGTGKSAFGQWLAMQLSRPLHLKRASDLLSPYVGQAEKNIAKAFNDATAANAVLQIDEVDSFLQSRNKAHHSWEVTQVNEFLTQMEAFSGVFIASTNLIDGFDAAALRRFELKAKFDYLRPEQSRGLLHAHLLANAIDPATELEMAELARLTNLTPGDFAALSRQHRYNPLPSARAWIDGLIRECRLKPTTGRQIVGFGLPAKST